MTRKTTKRIVIIGGGITGLAAAHRIQEVQPTDTQLKLLEAGPRPGGIVRTERRDDYVLEHGPDSFISEKPAAIQLAKRLGLESHLIQTNADYRRSFVVRKGRLLPVPAGFHLLAPSRFWPFLKSDIFSWRGKTQIAAEFFRHAQTNGSVDESLASFVRRRFGTEALERMAQPMVGGIYTANPEQLSVRATFPRFLDWEQKYGSVIRALRQRQTGAISDKSSSTQESSGARYSLFVSFDAGMQVLTDELSQRLPTKAVRTNCRVNRLHVDHQTSQWRVETEHDTLEADAICLTTPAYISAELLRETHSALACALQNISYESSATINLAYKRSDVAHPLNGFGFVVPVIEGLSLIACTFSSVKFAGRAPTEQVLLRAFVGGALQRDIMQLDDGEMVSRVQQDLSSLLQISNPPLFTTIARWERAMPQYHVGHLERVETIRRYERELPGLTLAGAAFSGVGIPDCVRSGEAAAEVMTSEK